MRAFILVLLVTLIGCDSDNQKIFESFSQEFSDSISKNKAKKYTYQLDGLVPQNSFFVGTKLKYLKYIHGPEKGSVESLVYFDLKTDSISKIIRRKAYYECDKKSKDFTDSIFLILNKSKQTFTYVNSNQIDSLFNRKEFNEDRAFIKRIKEATEKNYNATE